MAAVLVGLLLGMSTGLVRTELIYLGAGIVVFYVGHVLRSGKR